MVGHCFQLQDELQGEYNRSPCTERDVEDLLFLTRNADMRFKSELGDETFGEQFKILSEKVTFSKQQERVQRS